MTLLKKVYRNKEIVTVAQKCQFTNGNSDRRFDKTNEH